ncbi:hypothetical protein N7510_011311 [Penicillium lagena]|uniref:uncharacterized protein n=1 Tax=Penicillium lagena TaxID=94218 RepID=UPI002541E439|nr:uncharacterized protein N7510_011311 [Penicillium lagena]KAJ5601777.1 hypothetical protein N7510_011311 [Penicillium lagena]
MNESSQPSLKLWYSPGACSLAAHVLLLETGLNFDLELSQVGQFTDEFIKLNPKGRVPVLSLDGEVITEIPAILTAISCLVPEKHLLGETTLETARVYEWLNYLSGTLHGQGFGALWRPERFLDDESLFPKLQEHAVWTIRQCYGFIEDKIASSQCYYAVGGSFTIVDPFLFVLYRWGYRVEIEMRSEYPHFATWAARISIKNSVIRAWETHVGI